MANPLVNDYMKAGVFPAQHKGHRDQDVAIEWRAQTVFIRVRERLTDVGAKEYGHYKYEPDEDVGDLCGISIWQRNKDDEDKTRDRAAARAIWPGVVRTEEELEDKLHSFGDGQLPVSTIYDGEWEPDDRLGAAMTFEHPDLEQKYPGGWYGLVTMAQDENDQLDLFFPADPRLVACHTGGSTEYSTWVVDVGLDGKVHETRKGRLHDQFRATENALHMNFAFNGKGEPGLGFGSAFAIGDGAGGQSSVAGGPESYPSRAIIECLSHERQGPIHPGCTDDRHQVGTTVDGLPINGAHIWTNANYYRNKDEDGPLFFEGEWKSGGAGPIKTVTLAWDKDGLAWKWFGHGDIFSPGDTPDEDIPPYIPFERPTDKLNPGQNPAPGRYPYELRLPSIHIEGTREDDQADAGNPYDGRLGPEAEDGGLTSGTNRVLAAHIWGHTSWHTEDGRPEVEDWWTRVLGSPIPVQSAMVTGPGQFLADGGRDGLPSDYMRVESFTNHTIGRLSVGLYDTVQAKPDRALVMTSYRDGSGDFYGDMWVTDEDGAANSGVYIRVQAGLFTNSTANDIGKSAEPWGTGYFSGLDVQGDTTINGKLTVTGLIDPTGMQFDPQETSPADNCVWVKDNGVDPTTLMFTDSGGVDYRITMSEA